VVLACSSYVAYYITKSPKHLDDLNVTKEPVMNTQISSKIAALCMALMMNGLMMGGIAYLFSGHLQGPPSAVLALATV
jgi:hypothetical protein